MFPLNSCVYILLCNYVSINGKILYLPFFSLSFVDLGDFKLIYLYIYILPFICVFRSDISGAG